MDCGIVTAKVDEIGYITHAENLGYTHCWVTDSQMIAPIAGLCSHWQRNRPVPCAWAPG